MSSMTNTNQTKNPNLNLKIRNGHHVLRYGQCLYDSFFQSMFQSVDCLMEKKHINQKSVCEKVRITYVRPFLSFCSPFWCVCVSGGSTLKTTVQPISRNSCLFTKIGFIGLRIRFALAFCLFAFLAYSFYLTFYSFKYHNDLIRLRSEVFEVELQWFAGTFAV